MISYSTALFGFELLFRVHGSALYKSLPPALLSAIIYITLYYAFDKNTRNGSLLAPEPVMILVALLMFLLQFRANFSYSRYWEAMSSIHTMHGKLLDVGSKLAAYHLQAACYKDDRPPSYGYDQDHKKVNHHRQPSQPISLEDLKLQLEVMDFTNDYLSNKFMDMIHPIKDKLSSSVATVDSNANNSHVSQNRSDNPNSFRHRRNRSSLRDFEDLMKQHHRQQSEPVTLDELKTQFHDIDTPNEYLSDRIMDKIHPIKDTSHDIENSPKKSTRHRRNRSYFGLGRFSHDYDNGVNKIENDAIQSTTKVDALEAIPNIPITIESAPPEKVKETMDHNNAIKQPSLFLQEVVHLLSLLSAVASSTLRNDSEYAEATLTTFTAGQPFPHADPDAFTSDIRKDWDISKHKSVTSVHYLFGLNRSQKSRDIYNAARPFRVIGGVSDKEIAMIQAARGPFAKVSLIHMWLLEFVVRESLAGSTGSVHPIFISLINQLLSEFTAAYNHARMISKNPFPFVHAQLSSAFVVMVVGLLPIVMLTYVPNFALGLFLNLVTVMCFTGLHEVARELELPFKNAPNDIPLNNYQAQLNEALLTTFLGYHPDSYWDVPTNKTTTETRTNDNKGDSNPANRHDEFNNPQSPDF